jgi:thiamine-phosphate pyrophosphorylase
MARAARAALVFVSPVFSTRSHAGAAPLGSDRAAALGRLSGALVIALGGMDESRFHALRGRGFHGYVGVDCWLRI